MDKKNICPECKKKFESPLCLQEHLKKCPALFKRCRWVNLDGVICKFKGRYGDGFCKKHCLIDYYYNPDGVGNDKEELEGCSNYYNKKIIVSTKKSIEDNSEYNFIGIGNVKYEYIKSSVSTVTMKNLDTDENIIFWKDRESRGKRGGHLITTLRSELFKHYCEEVAVCKVEGNYYCEDCFEKCFTCRIETLENK